jgi:uncharacterized protein (TIGR00369 family)
MKRRTGEPWMLASKYGRSLTALTINLLVREIEAALVFQREVLGVAAVYSDPDFAVVRGYGAEWMLHADHTYDHHPLNALIAGGRPRGAGIELRLHGCDPDAAEAAARRCGFTVLASARDKGHGLREAHLVDADGYVWVPDVPTIDAITRERPDQEQTQMRLEGTAPEPIPLHDLVAWGRQALAAQPLSVLFGAHLSVFSTGHAELTVPLAPTLLQQHGFVHGGVISYAADTALTFAGGSVLGAHVVTSEYKINYVKPARGNRLLARATVIAAGQRQAVCRCEVFAMDGDQEMLVAAAQGTIVPMSAPPSDAAEPHSVQP